MDREFYTISVYVDKDENLIGIPCGDSDKYGIADIDTVMLLKAPYTDSALENYINKVSIPILAIGGDKDVMANWNMNRDNLLRITRNRSNVVTKEIKGMNHLMLPCEKGTTDEYSSIKAPVSAEAMKTIADFIISLVRR